MGADLARGFSIASTYAGPLVLSVTVPSSTISGSSSASGPTVRWLGRVSYAEGLRLQEEIVARHLAGNPQADTILLLEHEPVFTIGRTPDRSSLGDPANLPAPLIEIGRGGKATWHGPGQLVGYPILNLVRYGQDLHHYLRALEEALIQGCLALGVPATRSPGQTGVWVGNAISPAPSLSLPFPISPNPQALPPPSRKLASIGVGARRWISMHGFAINIHGPLEGFNAITPCGIESVTMTSLERERVDGLDVKLAAEHFTPFLLEQCAALHSA
ncbi:MAG: lipB [Verrucomicrobiales bacterium]|nr:lipB [Verrucomicrobiales bacterium]